MIPPRIRCSFNFPGHEPHQGRIMNFLRNRPASTGLVVDATSVNRTTIRLTLNDGSVRDFRHHQPDRVVGAFAERDGQAGLYLHEGLLVVPLGESSKYFFSLAVFGFLTCREYRERLEARKRATRGLTERHALVAYRLRGPIFETGDLPSEPDRTHPRRRTD